MSETDTPSEQGCACEARIAPSVLDGYACGRPECWRTAAAKASFDAFVADLVARREALAETRADP